MNPPFFGRPIQVPNERKEEKSTTAAHHKAYNQENLSSNPDRSGSSWYALLTFIPPMLWQTSGLGGMLNSTVECTSESKAITVAHL